MKITLRDYQQKGIDDLRGAFASGHRGIVYILPTGGGKTVVFCAISELAAAKGKRIAILVHRQELVDQTSESLSKIGVPHGKIVAGAGRKTKTLDLAEPLQVCSVQTLVRRLEWIDPDHFDLLVVDEAHHAVAGSWAQVIDHFSTAKVLGVTATPERLDGKGLKDFFSYMVLGPDCRDLTERGYLCQARAFVPPKVINARSMLRVRAGDYRLEEAEEAMSDRILVGDAVAHYGKHLYPGTAIAFCCTIRHAEIVRDAFLEAGYRAEVLDGKTNKDKRREMILGLGRGEIDVLCSCMVVSEGTDIPSVGGCLLLRPTKSLSLYLQQVGRCLRPTPGKERAVILDHAGNVYEHGLPTAPREWDLEGREARQKREGKESLGVKVCPSCYATIESSCVICPECGHEFEVSNGVREVDGELEEVEDEETWEKAMAVRMRSRRREVGRARSLEELQNIAAERGYSPGWAFHVYRSRQVKRYGAQQ
jgi:superfamily II DNA or RNA helicase